jgi:hypothetical protein
MNCLMSLPPRRIAQVEHRPLQGFALGDNYVFVLVVLQYVLRNIWNIYSK